MDPLYSCSVGITMRFPHIFKSPPAQVTLNWNTMSYHLIKAKEKQCLMTLPKEDQVMICLKTEKECLISRDKMKVMITCDHTQRITI